MKLFLRLLLVICVILSSCNNNSQKNSKGLKVIDVAGGVGKSRLVNLSEVADSIEYIPLETTPESLLSNPPHERILYEKDILYFPQKKGLIKIFDSKGKYVSTFNRLGRGPQEYDRLGKSLIDNASGKIIVNSTNKVVEYSLYGEFIRNITLQEYKKIDNIPLRFYCLKLGDYYFYPCFALSTYSVIITDSSSKVVKRLKYPQEELDFVKNMGRPFAFVEPNIYLYNDRILLINGVNKYVLSIDKDLSVDTVFIIDYGKYFPENKKSGSRSSHNPLYLLRRYNYFYESDNYLFMRFYLGSLSDKPFKMLNSSGSEWTDPNACALFNKETEEFTFLDQPEKYQIGFADDIEGGPGIWPMYVSADNYMISYIPAEEFIARAENHKVSANYKEIAAKLNETDNPVLVRVKLK